MMSSRDSRIDCLRLVLMFMICMIHAVGYVDSRWTHWLTNVCFSGVLGFVLISGFYGIRFSLSKVIKLEGVGLGCALTVVGGAWLAGEKFQFASAGAEVLTLWKGYWFIHAYVVMMFLAALVGECDASGEKENWMRMAVPFIVLVYGWSFLMLIPGVQKFIPRTPGLVPFSGITLFAGYLVGRLYRIFDWDRIPAKWVMVAALVGFLFSSSILPPFNSWGAPLARYNSPFLLLLSLSLFWLFRHLPKPSVPSLFLTLLTPSIFSVYLLHCNPHGYSVFAHVESWLSAHGVCSYGIYFFLAALAFVGGFLLDLPRRLLVRLFHKPISYLSSHLDQLYTTLISLPSKTS